MNAEIDDLGASAVNPDAWPQPVVPLPPASAVAAAEHILSGMTAERKVGQIIQADSASVTPKDVEGYALGSVLSGGNSAPGPKPWADAAAWLTQGDAFWKASVAAAPEGAAPVPILWGIDAVHGHNNLAGAVLFPHNIGLGASRDPALVRRIAHATATELRVSGHDWTFAPTLTTPQDARWGRTFEGFSSDPSIGAAYAEPLISGLQASSAEGGPILACAKHFIGDGATTNGADQGDAAISEDVLIQIHAPGYVAALEAGTMCIMASLSSWRGRKLHGHKGLLTTVLKERMGFWGFIVGDWNGHGGAEGCSATDAPDAILAGVDMVMAPDSWRGLYESTLSHVRSGRIPIERLDDAVRRILTVKAAMGLLDAPCPSARPLAGCTERLATEDHRETAREAVRRSLVLLKNEGNTVPLPRDTRILVTGNGADSIAKACGGWTLSWQGGDHPNSDFPNGQSIFASIADACEAASGTAVFSAAPTDAEVEDAAAIIVVYGEDPYAEFQGDRDHHAFIPAGYDVGADKLAKWRSLGTPVVSVFLSGRPLCVNHHLRASDAFIAAWLPGSEGGGVADMLFRTDPAYAFTGKLPMDWPGTASGAPLYPRGYGRDYNDVEPGPAIPEGPDLDALSRGRGEVFVKGRLGDGWCCTSTGGEVIATDYNAQEDALLITSDDGDTHFAFQARQPRDVRREASSAMVLAFSASLTGSPAALSVGLLGGGVRADVLLPIGSDWADKRISLSDFGDADLSSVTEMLAVSIPAGAALRLSNVRIEADINVGG